MIKKEKSGRKGIVRVLAAVLAVFLAVPSGVYAKTYGKIWQEIHHVHIGNEEEGGLCYGKEVKHEHLGSEAEGGVCFQSPVFHVHEGNEKESGECYRTEILHAHKGTQANGEGCYGQPVYHAHTGNADAGGGCYGLPVYHKHTGSGNLGGGCYGRPVYHTHTGNQTGKGGCYETPVYHAHSGSTTAGGGCYQTAVYHTHGGDEVSGGACFEPIYHQHMDSCYQEARCDMEYVGNLQIQREESGYCSHHGNANIVHFRANFRHQSCGRGIAEDGNSTCWTCQTMNSWHTYNKIVCGKDESTVEGYRRICGKETSTVEAWDLGCGKNEASVEKYVLSCGKSDKTIDSYQINCNKNDKTVDSYRTNCNKTEANIDRYALNCGKTWKDIDSYALSCTKDKETIDSYVISCGKTEETTDSYALSCTKNEKEGYAEFSVSNQKEQWTSEDVILRADIQDADGFLKLPSEPFCWNGAGVEEEETQEVTVKENGIYHVRLRLENEDVDEKEPMLSIEVKNIDKTAPSIEQIIFSKEADVESNTVRIIAKDLQPDGSPGSGLDEEAYSFDGGKTWQKENNLELKKNASLSLAVRDFCGNISAQNVEITNIKEEDGSQDKDTDGTEGEGQDKDTDGTEGEGQDKDTDGTGGEGQDKDTDGTEGEGQEKDTDGAEGEGVDKDTDGTGEEGQDRDTDGAEEGEQDKDGTGEEGKDGDKEGNEEENRDKNEEKDKNQSGNKNESQQGNQDGNQGGSHEGNASGSLGGKPQENETNQKENAGKETNQEIDKSVEAMKKETKRTGMDGKIQGEMAGKEKKELKNRAEVEKRKITLPDKQEPYEEEIIEIELPKTGAEPENNSRARVLTRAEAVGKVAKAVTFTVSSIMLAAGLIYLIYLMFRSIQIFDCDGEGNVRYVGSCIMKRTEGGFEVRIPNMIWEHSSTGQYNLRPSKAFAKKNKGKELIVMAGENRESVWIDKDIPFRMSMYV